MIENDGNGRWCGFRVVSVGVISVCDVGGCGRWVHVMEGVMREGLEREGVRRLGWLGLREEIEDE